MKTTRRRRGDKLYEYVSLVRAVRVDGKVKHETLLRLGEVTALRRSSELERVVNALERDRITGLLQAEQSRSIGAVAAVETIWNQLGLSNWFTKVGEDRGADRLADAVFTMVANRLIDPCWGVTRSDS